LSFSFTIGASGDVFAGTYFGGGVFRSSDNGENWSEQNHGLAATEVRAVAVNASNDIFAGTYGVGIFRSTDGGATWGKANHGLPGLYISCLTIKGNGDIFAGADFMSGFGGVFRSMRQQGELGRGQPGRHHDRRASPRRQPEWRHFRRD
jgi:hypothetical protein